MPRCVFHATSDPQLGPADPGCAPGVCSGSNRDPPSAPRPPGPGRHRLIKSQDPDFPSPLSTFSKATSTQKPKQRGKIKTKKEARKRGANFCGTRDNRKKRRMHRSMHAERHRDTRRQARHVTSRQIAHANQSIETPEIALSQDSGSPHTQCHSHGPLKRRT